MNKCFRDQFKFYKNKMTSLDLKEFDDFYDKENGCSKSVSSVDSTFSWEKSFGMKNPREWKVYEVSKKPGLLVIKNPFHYSGQRYWITRCLKYYTRKPSKLNLDAHSIINPTDDWWEYCQRMKDTDKGASVLKKLRWATFGYHHNWNTKEYSEHFKCDFPTDLHVLCRKVGEVLSFFNFDAQAAIINMYHYGSTLSGHTDNSELCSSAPLFSFSFGQSAVFLIGGKTLDEEAVPIILESGDIIIMSNESRLCYHGVPRILPTKSETWNGINASKIELDDKYLVREVIDELSIHEFWNPFNSYVGKSRINMNVRQVLHSDQKILNDI